MQFVGIMGMMRDAATNYSEPHSASLFSLVITKGRACTKPPIPGGLCLIAFATPENSFLHGVPAAASHGIQCVAVVVHHMGRGKRKSALSFLLPFRNKVYLYFRNLQRNRMSHDRHLGFA